MSDKPMKVLTEQEEKFCLYYMQGMSILEATKLAFGGLGSYFGKNAPLKRPHIQARIQELSKTIRKKNKKEIADISEIMTFLTKVMRGAVVEDEVERETVKQENNNVEKIREFTRSAPMRDRVKAAEIMVKTNYVYETMNPNATDKVIILGENDILE